MVWLMGLSLKYVKRVEACKQREQMQTIDNQHTDGRYNIGIGRFRGLSQNRGRVIFRVQIPLSACISSAWSADCFYWALNGQGQIS